MNFFKSLFKEKPGKPKANLAAAAYQVSNHPLGNQRPLRTMIALEPRIMFDGAAVVTAVDTVIDAKPPVQDAPAVDASKLADAISPAVVDAAPQRIEIVFIENNLADYQTLVNDVTPGTEVHVLDGSQDGLAQMAHILDGRSGIDAIHIVSHGAEGVVGLGSLNLTAQNLQQHSADLANIGSALSQNADILLYGCNVSAGSNGAAFISALADLTHADIAASNDLTGAAAKGGDWVLESASGQVETAVLQFAGFQGILPSVAGTIAPTSGNNGIDYGLVFSDGEGGSTDIAGIEYDFYCVDGANNLVNTVAVFTSTPNVTSYTGLLSSEQDSSADGVVFKSSAGENFKLTSFFIQDYDMMDGTWTVSAYDSGNLVGTPQTFTITQSGEYARTVSLTSDFQNIDEVRITVAGGTSGGHIYATLFSNFVVADLVLPDVTPPTVGSITRVDTATSNATTVHYTVTFDESVTGVGTSDFALTTTGTVGGSISAVSGSGDTYTVTVSSVTGDGTLRLDLNSKGAGIADTSSNAITTGFTSGQVYTFDHTAPAIGTPDLTPASDSGASNTDNLTNKTTPNFNGTTEANATVYLYDSNGKTSLGSTTANSIGRWIITSSTLSEGVHMVSAKAADPAGNISSASSTLAVTIDTTAPSVAIVVSDTSLSIGEDSLVTFTFSEAVTGFDNADLTIANGSLSTVSTIDGGTTYTATFTPTAVTSAASNVISVDKTGVADAVGNAGVGSTNSNNYQIDTQRPTATIVMADTSLTVGETSSVTFTFSEAVTGFTSGDLTIANGTLSSIYSPSKDNVTFKATFTPTANITDATNLITIAMAGVQDTAGNSGSGSTDSNNFAIDNVRPTATIVVADNSLTVGEASSVTFTFSEAVTNFDNSDLTIENGSLTGVSSNDGGITWTATFTPTIIIDSSNLINIDNTTLTDIAGNAGSGSTDSNNYAINNVVVPAVNSVTQSSGDGYYKTGDTVTLSVNFDQAVTVNPASGTPYLLLETGASDEQASYVSGSGTNVLTFMFTVQFGDNSVDLQYQSISALVLNGGTIKSTSDGTTAANLALPALVSGSSLAGASAVIVDTTRPTASIVVADNSLTVGETSLVTFTFSEAVTGFTNSDLDLKIANGTLDTVSSIDGGITYTATFIPTSSIIDASNLITIDMTGVQDAAGNAGTGMTNSNNYAIDTVRPTVNIVVSDTAVLAGETSLVTFTFSEAVTGFNDADLIIANGTLDAISSTDNITYTATFRPTASITDATNLIRIANAGVQDAAGNAGKGTTDSNNYAIATVRPTAGIVVADSALVAGETSLVTFTFSEAVLDFSNDDLTIVNGSLSTVGSIDGGTTYTATFTPTVSITDATNVITLANTGVTNAVGNAGSGTTDSNNYAIATVRPTATIVVADNSLTVGETSLVTFTFTEAVTGFTPADVTVPNGKLYNLLSIDGGITWTATLTPSTSTTAASNVLTLNKTGIQDLAGNAGTGSVTSGNYAVDTVRPTLASSIVISNTALKIDSSATVTFTFNEAVTGFTSTNVTVPNGLLSNLSSSDGGITWTATLTPSTSTTAASNVLTLDNTGIQDLAGNAGTGNSTSSNYMVDTTPAVSTGINLSQISGNAESRSSSVNSNAVVINNSAISNTGNSSAGNNVIVMTGNNSLSTSIDNNSANSRFSSDSFNSSSLSPSSSFSQTIVVDMKLNINSSSGNAMANTISLPSSAFSGLNADGILSITATQSTGQSLPSWISVNPSTGAVTVKAGAVVTSPITVKVIIRDAQGKQVEVLVKVQAQKDATESKPSAQKPKQDQQTDNEKNLPATKDPAQQQGQREQSDQSLAQVIKPGLTEQLKQTGSKGFELKRSKLLASVASLVAKDAA